MNFIKVLLILSLFTGFYANAQDLAISQEKYVDSLTSHWNKGNHAGGTLAIIHDGAIVLKKTLGSSNVETAKPITPQTPFQLAQLSDSFIAFALLQLHQEKQLSLEDALSSYLPELNVLSSTLKVEHLLQHSSGIHDFEILKNIAGWTDTGNFSQNDALALIRNQNALSFEPGKEFSYSRSNILLASQVIAKASQMDFSEYLKKHVFEPMGMVNTFVLSTKNQNADQIAASYAVSEEGEHTRIPSKKENYASINIVASIDDMIKWEMNLSSPSSETEQTVGHFKTYVKLKGDSEYRVPSGKLTYGQRYVHKERGLEIVMSTGGIDGFASAIFNFPSEDFTVITLSNNGEAYNGYIGMLSAHSLLDEAFEEPSSIDFNALKTVPLDPNYHNKYEGFYWDALGELSRELRIENDTLRYIRSSEVRSTLIPLSKDTFQMKTDFDDKIYITFSLDAEKGTKMEFIFGEATPIEFIKYKPTTFTATILKSKYTGDYYCKALGMGYALKAGENTLTASNVKSDTIIFSPITKEIFSGDKWYMGSIEFVTDPENNVLGFFVRNDAVRNLWFTKVEVEKRI